MHRPTIGLEVHPVNPDKSGNGAGTLALINFR